MRLAVMLCVVGLAAGARADAPLRAGWPGAAGPLGTFEAPAGVPLVEDLSQARRLWESEFRDLGRAKGGSQAYRKVAQFTAEAIAKMGSHPGSWAGPVVADGLVIAASWRPTGPWTTVEGHSVRLDAGDFVVALDAMTGKTRWPAVEPGGLLRGGGKRQGFQVGPVVRDGVVYSLGSTARLFAHDLATGRKLWESDVHPARAAQKKARETARANLAAGKFAYDLTPNWCSSLAATAEALVVPDQVGGLLGVDRATGAKKWAAAGVISRWATPSVWRHDGREYVLCANEKGELRLLEPGSGRVLWTLAGLGPTWFTLAPGRTHVLVNVEAGSGNTEGGRKAGRLGAVKISPTGGERAWTVGDGTDHAVPVWMDSGPRVRVAYRDGRFLVLNGRAEKSDDGGTADAARGTAFLIEETTGKVLDRLPAATAWNDQLSGLVYWCGDRVLTRADSFHGPKHGGRHPWSHWTCAWAGRTAGRCS